jgi:hypothetical protein
MSSEPGDLQFILCVPMFCTLICVCAVLDCLCGCGYHQKYADCICVLCSQAPELQLINAVKAGEYGTVYSFIKQNDRATIDRADEVSICDPDLFQFFNVGVSCQQGGLTAMHWAAREGRCKILRLLIKRGCNINARDAVRPDIPLRVLYVLCTVSHSNSADTEDSADVGKPTRICRCYSYPLTSEQAEAGTSIT